MFVYLSFVVRSFASAAAMTVAGSFERDARLGLEVLTTARAPPSGAERVCLESLKSSTTSRACKRALEVLRNLGARKTETRVS